MKALKFLPLFLIVITVLGGCSSSEKESAVSIPSAIIDYEKEYRESPVNDLLSHKWKQDPIKKSNAYMTLKEYIFDILPHHEDTETVKYVYRRSRSFDGKIYVLYSVIDLSSDAAHGTHIIDILDGNTYEVTTVEFDVPNNAFAFEPCNDCIYIYASISGQTELSSFEAYKCSYTGDIEKIIDLKDVLVSQGLIYPDYYDSRPTYQCDIYFDSISECFYFPAYDLSRLVITDVTGKVLGSFDGFSKEYSEISEFGKTTAGLQLFKCYDSSNEAFNIFYFKNAKPEIIYSGEAMAFLQSSFDSHNNFIYRSADGGSYVSWNPETGKHENLYIRISEYITPSVKGVVRNDAGELVMIENGNLRVLSSTSPKENVTLKITSNISPTDNLEKAFRFYTESHPGVKFELLSDNDPSNGILDLGKEDGPDLWLLYPEAISFVNPQDCLLDLSDSLNEDVQRNLVPAVLNYGKTDEGTYMFPLYSNAFVLWTKKGLLNKEAWTISDTLDIIESREKAGKPYDYISLSPHNYAENPINIFIPCIQDSDFVDLVNGKCDFTNSKFIRLLEVCKRYNDKLSKYNSNSEDPIELLKEDRVLFINDPFLSFSSFSDISKELGPDYCYIGYPTNKENGKLFHAVLCLAVNKESKYVDIIKDFINCFYSADYADDNIIPFRTDRYDGLITDADKWTRFETDSPVITIMDMDGTRYRTVSGKPDGTSYLEEYKAFLNSLKPAVSINTEISDVIYEEIAPFFEGQKSATEVAQIIQSRVSIMLAEQK